MRQYPKILFATKNIGKFVEFSETFRRLGGRNEIVSLCDLSYDIPECEETGSTFTENALLKANHTKKHLQEKDQSLIIIADDSGMEITSLNGEPGVKTRRWNGTTMSDDEIINYCLNRMKGINDRSAQFKSCFAILSPGKKPKIVHSTSQGIILKRCREESKLKGLPFRSLFYVPELKMMFHDVRKLPANKRKNYKLSHEAAIEKILCILYE